MASTVDVTGGGHFDDSGSLPDSGAPAVTPATGNASGHRARTIPAMALPEHGMSTAEVIAALTEKRGTRRALAGRPHVRDGLRRRSRGARGRATRRPQLFLHENALNTTAFPSLAEIQSEVVGAVRRPVPRAAGRGRVHDVGRHREHPHGGEGGARAGRAERGVTAPEMVIADERARRVPQGRALLRRARAQGRRRRRLARRRRRDGRAVDDEHRARRRLRAAVPAGRDRSDPRARRSSRRASARRCTSTRAWAASCSRSWR